MKLLSEQEFEKMTGNMMLPRRKMGTFNGDEFQCGCGQKHIFQENNIKVISEGMNGKFVIACPNESNILSLIKTKMKFGIVYQGLEFLGATKI